MKDIRKSASSSSVLFPDYAAMLRPLFSSSVNRRTRKSGKHNVSKKDDGDLNTPVSIRVLLVEDNPDDSMLIKRMLDSSSSVTFDVHSAESLSNGLEILNNNKVDIILLDLALPDSQGLETFLTAQTCAREIPIILLTGLDDDEVAAESVHAGAQDYLIKGKIDNDGLLRSLRYAIERNRLQKELRRLALVDELTGLHNRRGFFNYARHQLKLCNRNGRGFYLFFIDMDDMSNINNRLGHQSGDLSLINVAIILRECFRQTDIIARIGGDEFAVMALDADSTDTIVANIQERLDEYNAIQDNPVSLSLSLGVAFYDGSNPCSLEDLLDLADKHMYAHKESKKIGISKH